MSRVRARGDWPTGKILRLQHESRALRDNPWQDPAKREVHVYLPPGYRDDEPHVALWDLAAFTSAGPAHLNWRHHGENLPARLDRLIGQGSMPPVVVVIPDCYTSLGGNQYVNSAAVGNYADYLVGELLPFVATQVNLVGRREGRGLFGHSSGGYGALYHAMHYPEVWGAAASHAGDVGFELVYRPAFADVCSALARHDGDATAFVRAFWEKNRPSSEDFTALMMLAMAASYDPDPKNPATIRLPFDLRTCTLDVERWQKWLAFDPLQLVLEKAAALKQLHALYLDVGTRDEYHVQFGTRLLVDRLRQMGVAVHYEEFEGGHSGMDWRLDHSLPMMAGALKNALAKAT
jgi:enterochelin esterase-like enzyme